jgi:hypothetical protein
MPDDALHKNISTQKSASTSAKSQQNNGLLYWPWGTWRLANMATLSENEEIKSECSVQCKVWKCNLICCHQTVLINLDLWCPPQGIVIILWQARHCFRVAAILWCKDVCKSLVPLPRSLSIMVIVFNLVPQGWNFFRSQILEMHLTFFIPSGPPSASVSSELMPSGPSRSYNVWTWPQNSGLLSKYMSMMWPQH